MATTRRSDSVRRRIRENAEERARRNAEEHGASVVTLMRKEITHREAVALVERALRDSTGGDVVTGWSGRWWG